MNGKQDVPARPRADERVSLAPLTPEEALRALLAVDPDDEPVAGTDEGHVIEVVGNGHSHRWRCSCGANTSGRWYPSIEEAQKAADRHVQRHG